MIRLAKKEDLNRIIDIQNQFIFLGISKHSKKIVANEKIEWFLNHSMDYPLFVKEENGDLIGWYSISPYHNNTNELKDTCELNFFVDNHHKFKGFGKELVEHAINFARNHGKRVLVSILQERNKRGVYFLQNSGFKAWGYFPDIADIKGVYYSYIYMGKVVK